MTGRLEGKVAIITGGSMGLGAACAEMFVAEGAQVVIADIAEEAGKALADTLGNATFMALDVRSESAWAKLMSDVEAQFGKLDILVNNAGITRITPLEQVTLEEFRLVHQVMTEGTFLGCKAAFPLMTKNGGGSIVNMASVAATKGPSMVPAYSGSKAAIITMGRSMANHSREQGYKIRVNAVLPAAFDTPMMTFARDSMTGLGQQTSHVEAQKCGDPKYVAYAVLFLASDEAGMVSGTTLTVDNASAER